MQRVIRLTDPVARRLHQLGCTDAQVVRYMARGRLPPTTVPIRPRPLAWCSWAARIRDADLWPARPKPHGEPK